MKIHARAGLVGAAFALMLSFPVVLDAQQGERQETTRRRAGEGGGPYDRLVLQNVTVIDGTGAPPISGTNIVVTGDRIESIGRGSVDEMAGNTRVIDGTGMYVMPGFVDMHAHVGPFPSDAPQAEYVYKLWMAHGITTSRGVPHGSFEWSLRQKALSARNQIVAPRMFSYLNPGTGEGWGGRPINDPETAREWVRWAAAQEIDGQKIDGLKLGAHDPEIMEALIDEAHKFGLGTVAHLNQMGVGRMTALDAARAGLDMMTHYYGLFESMLKDYSVQDWPLDYDYANEQHRFGNVARLWNQIYEPGSDEWYALMDEFLELGFGIDPTMTIYEANRDVMRAREAEWHDEYTLPSLWEFYQPSKEAHGSYWFDWTTEDEVAWRNYYIRWMRFLNEFKNRGGRVTTGSDSGFIYKLYGFDYIRELELLREAGFHPVEVIRSATLHGAQELHDPKGERIDFGIIRPGLKADFVVVDENPLHNLKVLYGTGTPRMDMESGVTSRIGGITYTIKDGIVYDAKQLLEDVREMVRREKAQKAVSEDPMAGRR